MKKEVTLQDMMKVIRADVNILQTLRYAIEDSETNLPDYYIEAFLRCSERICIGCDIVSITIHQSGPAVRNIPVIPVNENDLIVLKGAL